MAKFPVAPPPDSEEPATMSVDLCDGIRRQILAELGRPPEFLRLSVRRVTRENYRVNVVVGPDVSAARIAHSFFVAVDDLGKVMATTPKIARMY
jgi:hypothetical protein